MKKAYRVLLTIISSLVLVVTGMFLITNVASGSAPASFDSGTASCITNTTGYCNGPTLPFTPNAVTITVQAPISGSAIPSQAMAQLSTSTFRARFLTATGGVAASMKVTYSYLATRGKTPTPTTTTTKPPTPTTKPPTPTPGGSTGTVIANAYVTGYGWPDNSPPGTAISDPILHKGAGGTGTYADPITIAVGYTSTTRDYTPGTRFYIPNVRRYFIVEDTCSSCHNTPSGASTWVDMWVGGNGKNDSAVLACENALTDNHTIIRNPDPNRVVVPGSLFNSTTGTCTAQFGG